MSPSHDEILNRWLAAERDGRDDEAGEALFALFEAEALPPLAPPAGFADRVLARAGVVAAVPERRTFFAGLWFRGFVTLALLVTGLSLPWLSEALQALAGLAGHFWSPGDLIRLGTAALTTVSQVLVAALAVWDWVLEIGRALATPFATPRMALVVIVCLLTSLVAFHFLRNLITRDRSWSHVESI